MKFNHKFSNKIEWRQLKAMGASAEQLTAYSETDPLNIYEKNGLYFIRGCIEADNITAGDVLDFLNMLAASSLDDI